MADETLDDDGLVDSSAGTTDSSAVISRRTPRPEAARRTATLGRVGGLTAAATGPRVDYHYVIRDLKRIAITAVAMLVLLIVLNLIIQSLIH